MVTQTRTAYQCELLKVKKADKSKDKDANLQGGAGMQKAIQDSQGSSTSAKTEDHHGVKRLVDGAPKDSKDVSFLLR